MVETESGNTQIQTIQVRRGGTYVIKDGVEVLLEESTAESEQSPAAPAAVPNEIAAVLSQTGFELSSTIEQSNFSQEFLQSLLDAEQAGQRRRLVVRALQQALSKFSAEQEVK